MISCPDRQPYQCQHLPRQHVVILAKTRNLGGLGRVEVPKRTTRYCRIEGCVEGLGKPLVAHFRVQLSSWCVALSQACNITMVLRTEVGSAPGSLNAWSSIPGSVWILFVEVLQSVVNPWTRQETPNRPGLGFLGWKSGGDPQFLKPQPGSFPPRA